MQQLQLKKEVKLNLVASNSKHDLKYDLSNEITQMVWMKDAEVFYRQRDNEIKTAVNRLDVYLLHQ